MIPFQVPKLPRVWLQTAGQPEMAALCAPMLDELTALWNDIFLRGQQVPDCFGRAKVYLLGKTALPSTINDCRPRS